MAGDTSFSLFPTPSTGAMPQSENHRRRSSLEEEPSKIHNISRTFSDDEEDFDGHDGLAGFGQSPDGEILNGGQTDNFSNVDICNTAQEMYNEEQENCQNGGTYKPQHSPVSPPSSPPENFTSLTFCDESHRDSNAHPSESMYDNWSCDEDQNYDKRKSKSKKRRSRNNSSGTNDDTISEDGDVGWKIISALLKGWFAIWVAFAIFSIAFSLSHPHHPRKKILDTSAGTTSNSRVAGEYYLLPSMKSMDDPTDLEEQQEILFTMSEQIINTCSFSNMNTSIGRGECQTLCQGHMCCFTDDNGNDDIDSMSETDGEGQGYGCADNPEKMCAVYAGCEALVVSLDDASFDDDVVLAFENGDHIKTEEEQSIQQSTDPSSSADPLSPNSQSTTTNSSTTTELGLVQEVIATECSTDNLHTRHGILECAALCKPSLCCFDKSEIDSLNPHLDIILRLEGVNNDVLDLSALGTCLKEDESGSQPSHFCSVHTECKNLLLFGSPSSKSTSKKRNPSSGKNQLPVNIGVADIAVSNTSTGESIDPNSNDQKRQLITYFALFGAIAAVAMYLNLCTRVRTSVTKEIAKRNRKMEDLVDNESIGDREMVDFV